MKELLANIKARLEKGEYKNEEHVRLSLVARVLQNLGWDIWNPMEVNAEFVVVPSEDNKKVDVALFLRPIVPSVFIEIKAVGQMQGKLTAIELQMRNYNRDNQAMFTVITDGRNWRFYLSSASGEFSRRCFKTFDLLDEDAEQVEASLSAFLKKSEIENENARHKAENYLKLNLIQRTTEDCLPEARRKISEPPYPSLPDALMSLVCEKGFSITKDEAVKFIKEADERKPPVTIAFQTTQNTGKFALIVRLAKAGKTESQIAAEVKTEFGPLSSHTTYLVGREWRRVNNVGRHFGSTSKLDVNPSKVPTREYVSLAGRSAFIRELRDNGSNWATAWEIIRDKYPGSSISKCKKVWEKQARTPRTDNPVSFGKKTSGKLAFVESHLTAEGENRKTKSEIVKLFMKEFPDVSEKTAKNTVSWTASRLKKRTGKIIRAFTVRDTLA